MDELPKEWDQILEIIKEKLKCAQTIMKMKADQNRREVDLEVGEMVYLRFHPYRLH